MRSPLLLLLALVPLVAGCHIDDLLKGPGGRTPTPGASTRLAFTAEPGDATAGQSLAPVQVTVRDQAGEPVTAFDGNITVALRDNPGGATLSGNATVPAQGGVATFSDLRLDHAGTGYTLRAAASGMSEAISAPFNITASPPPPLATQLIFTVPPSDAFPGATIQPPVEVTAADDNGNAVSTFTGDVTIAIGRNAGVLSPGSLSGTKKVTAVNGVARFTDLSIDQPGVGYTLRATASGLPGVESASFTILVP